MSECIGPNVCPTCGGEYGEHFDGFGCRSRPSASQAIQIARVQLHDVREMAAKARRADYGPADVRMLADAVGQLADVAEKLCDLLQRVTP